MQNNSAIPNKYTLENKSEITRDEKPKQAIFKVIVRIRQNIIVKNVT